MTNIVGPLPDNLQNGTTADASQVMANLNFIINAINTYGLALADLPGQMLENLSLGSLVGVKPFTQTGTYNPSTNANSALVIGQGAGGAGGGAPAAATGAITLGLGGNAGAFGVLYVPTGVAATSVTIGAGGTGVSGAAGNGGGATSFGLLMQCAGGAGGTYAGPSSGFVGGQNTAAAAVTGSGNIIVSGGGDTARVPAIALNVSNFISGPGASSRFGVGAAAIFNYGPGLTGTGYGSGGSGAASSNGTNAYAGGSGSQGYVLVFEFAGP
ncbi:hypothetical protein [Paraburkholderia tropica]|uniref:Uncharacterized protein n=1 Tax=Paraburkholderia tropica TaxID=92647 RepID=A0AAQ1GJ43_9BURK|nr:hypothetical protein [Paraburkholderia tropica]RQN37369.1 hypothetical protein EHZ25_18580 [Paraburkholderia tropica]SEK02520.1 hypothetical protein SAMN05216550_113183 [Paraburkholderia tropica]